MSLDHDAEPETRGHTPDAPLSISQLNWYIKNLLEQSLPSLWAAGEVSDLSRPSSGHLYFTLKDEQSQIRAVIWRSAAQRIPFKLEDGMSIVCSGSVEVYSPRGTYQLIIKRLQPLGIGPLQLAFQQLHRKLAAEGLFAPEKKRPLPRFPSRIGFVTSPSGAALHDFLEAAKSRWPSFALTIIPARVQGVGATHDLIRGIQAAQSLSPQLDVLIVGRGGGSIEDLWAFNDEQVVRTLSACRLPTVSAVGHEIDVTLCDLAADHRALTPTHAAQLVLPDRNELRNHLRQLERRAHQAVRGRTHTLRSRLEQLADRSVLSRPHDIHNLRRQMIDEWEMRARSAIWNCWRAQRERVAGLARATEALSPLGVLARGYSLTQTTDSRQPVRSWQQVEAGDEVTTILQDGSLECRILNARPKQFDP